MFLTLNVLLWVLSLSSLTIVRGRAAPLISDQAMSTNRESFISLAACAVLSPDPQTRSFRILNNQKADQAHKKEYSWLYLNGHLYKTNISVKRTPRVGPCLSWLYLFDSLDTIGQTLTAGTKGVPRLRESWLFCESTPNDLKVNFQDLKDWIVLKKVRIKQSTKMVYILYSLNLKQLLLVIATPTERARFHS